MVGCYFITPSIFRTDTLAAKPDCILAGRVTLRTSFYIFPLLRRQPSLHSLPWKSVEHAQKTEMSVLSTLFGEQTPRYRLYTQLFKRGYTRFLQRSGFASKDLAFCNEGLIFLFQFLPFLSFFFFFSFCCSAYFRREIRVRIVMKVSLLMVRAVTSALSGERWLLSRLASTLRIDEYSVWVRNWCFQFYTLCWIECCWLDSWQGR